LARRPRVRVGVDEVPESGWGSRTRSRSPQLVRSVTVAPAWNVPAPVGCWIQHVHNCLWGGVAHPGTSPTVEMVSGPLCPGREAGEITGRAPGGPQEPGGVRVGYVGPTGSGGLGCDVRVIRVRARAQGPGLNGGDVIMWWSGPSSGRGAAAGAGTRPERRGRDV
jgi:hypothetical protein